MQPDKDNEESLKIKKTLKEFLSAHLDMINLGITLISIIITIVGFFSAVSAINNSIGFINNELNSIRSDLNQTQTQNITIIASPPEVKEDEPVFMDYSEQAKNGVVSAQLWLAEYYISIDYYLNALYWYKNIIDQKIGSEEELSIANNNLGWLYINGYGLSDYDLYSPNRYFEAFSCFYAAAELGLELGKENASETVRLPNFGQIDGKQVWGYLGNEQVQLFIKKYNIELVDLSEVDSSDAIYHQYLRASSYMGAYTTYQNFHCVYSGQAVEPGNDPSGLSHTIFFYYGSLYPGEGQVENCRMYHLPE